MCNLNIKLRIENNKKKFSFEGDFSTEDISLFIKKSQQCSSDRRSAVSETPPPQLWINLCLKCKTVLHFKWYTNLMILATWLSGIQWQYNDCEFDDSVISSWFTDVHNYNVVLILTLNSCLWKLNNSILVEIN